MRSQEYSTTAPDIDEFGDSARASGLMAIAGSLQVGNTEGHRLYLAVRHPELADYIGEWPPEAVEAMYTQEIDLRIQSPDTMV